MKKLDELLKDNENAEAIKAVVADMVDAEITKGKEASGEKSRDNVQLRAKVKAFKDVLTGAGVDVADKGDLESQIESISGQLDGLSKESGNKDELKQLKAENAKLKLSASELSEANKSYQSREEKVKTDRIRAAAESALTKANATKFDDTLELMLMKGEVTIDDADQIICKDGENNLSLDQGIQKFIDSGRITIKNANKGGSGGDSAGGSSTDESDKTYLDYLSS